MLRVLSLVVVFWVGFFILIHGFWNIGGLDLFLPLVNCMQLDSAVLVNV